MQEKTWSKLEKLKTGLTLHWIRLKVLNNFLKIASFIKYRQKVINFVRSL